MLQGCYSGEHYRCKYLKEHRVKLVWLPESQGPPVILWDHRRAGRTNWEKEPSKNVLFFFFAIKRQTKVKHGGK